MKKEIRELDDRKFDAKGVVIPTPENIKQHINTTRKLIKTQQKISAILDDLVAAKRKNG